MSKDERMRPMKERMQAAGRQGGFSSLELIVSIAILTTVIAVVTDGIVQIEKKSASDVNKVGLAQESRQFMDQILRDFRQSGFPSMAMFDPTHSDLGHGLHPGRQRGVHSKELSRRPRFNLREILTEAA